MSISTLADRKIEHLRARASTATQPASSDNAAAAKTIADALSAVAAYVPTEIIAIYGLVIATAVKPITGGKETPLSIGTFLGFLVATPIFAWLVFTVKKIAHDRNKLILRAWRSWPWWEAISAMIAFTAWSAMMPHSAFKDLNPNTAAIGLVVVSALLPLLGGLFAKVNA